MMIFYAGGDLLDIHVNFHPLSMRLHDVIYQVMAATCELASIAFYFCLLRGRRNWIFWVAIGSMSVYIVLFLADFDLVGNIFSPALLNAMATVHYVPISIWISALLIRRASEGLPDSRLLLGPVLLQQVVTTADEVSNVFQQAGWIRQRPDWLERTWDWPFPISIPAVTDAFFLLAILGVLIYRFTRTRQQEERFSNELEAARTVQQVLIPTEVSPIPAFAIASVYKPASQVGGDFFQVIPDKNGGALVVIGDVSRKGMPAAMTVSLLVGTVRTLAYYTQSPLEILAAMNVRMLGRSAGGFTTCLVLRADPDGTFIVANAGHLAPVLSGVELQLENGLPLGLAAETVYAESTFHLGLGEQLTLMTDGVVEARNKEGELYGSIELRRSQRQQRR